MPEHAMTTPVGTMNYSGKHEAPHEAGTPPFTLEALRLMAQAMEELMHAGAREQTLALLRDYAKRLAGADDAIAILLDTGDCEHEGAPLEQACCALLSRLTDEARQQGRTVVLADAAADPRIPADIAMSSGIASAVLVTPPMEASPAAIAFVWRSRHALPPERIATLEILARAVCSALERQVYAESLRETEARFTTLGEASPALIWQSDAEGNIVLANHRFEDPGVPAAAWDALLHEEDLPGFTAAFADARRRHAPLQWRVRAKNAHGRWRWLDIHALPVVDDGDDGSYVGIAIDISEALEAEQALRQANRRKDEFLATLAHELRNPLAPISNVMYMLRHEGGRRRADRLLQIVERQVRHIVRLVDDLLEMSRITRGQISLRIGPLMLADAVSAAVETARPQIEANHHRLELRLPEEPVQLEGDLVRLTQIFANLLNNAARYTAPGGAIRLSAQREGDSVTISVRDNGMGITPELHARIFDLFTRGQRSDGCGPGGLGVGLSMVKSLVEMHGGSVEVHSAGPGKGSEFIVRLPLSRRQPHRPE
jgi:PAS domain S-box-containing protein